MSELCSDGILPCACWPRALIIFAKGRETSSNHKTSSVFSTSSWWLLPWTNSSDCQCCALQVSAASTPSVDAHQPTTSSNQTIDVHQPNNQYVTGTGQVGAVVAARLVASAQLFRHTLHPQFGCYKDKADSGVFYCLGDSRSPASSRFPCVRLCCSYNADFLSVSSSGVLLVLDPGRPGYVCGTAG